MNGWYVVKSVPLLWFHIHKYLVMSPPMSTPFGNAQMRGWVWRRVNATMFLDRRAAKKASRPRNDEHLMEVTGHSTNCCEASGNGIPEWIKEYDLYYAKGEKGELSAYEVGRQRTLARLLSEHGRKVD